MKNNNLHPEELLPWYVNGTLTDDEHRKVEDHLKECDRCRNEVSYLHPLHAQVKKTGMVSLPGELGLKRLLRDVKREIKKEEPSFFQRYTWWQPALAVAAAIVIVVQGILLYNLAHPPGPITILSGPAHEGVVLQVRFAPDATEEQIRNLLQSVGGSLIDGPGVLGIYRIRLDAAAEEEDRVNELIAALKSRTDVVNHVARE